MSEKKKSSGLGRLGIVGVVTSYAMARVTPNASVRRLVAALSSPDEDTSIAAYMALVKLGPDCAQRVIREMQKGAVTPELLQLLGDLGNSSVIPYLEEFKDSGDQALASAARESLERLSPE